MEKKQDKTGGEWVNDMRVQSENIAFDAEQMLTCGKCSRANPPNRVKCLHCGTGLEVPDAQAVNVVPVSRKLESWEKGYNIILLPSADVAGGNLGEIARAVSLDPAALREITETNRPMPAARVETEKEAEILARFLNGKGIETAIVADRSLADEIPPKRLRGMSFEGENLIVTLFNTGETEEIKNTRLALIVTGVIFEQKTESLEKRKKRESKTLEEWETSADEGLIDIYTEHDPTGFRIPTNGFDFSCLGSAKGILAGENIGRLAAKLREFAPRARLADRYLSDKRALAHVWEIEHRNDFRGFRRSGFGKTDLGKIASSSNLRQFTKYSRLQWQLL